MKLSTFSNIYVNYINIWRLTVRFSNNTYIKFKPFFLMVISVVVFIGGCSSTNTNAPEVSSDGLLLVKATRNTVVYKKEGVDLGKFSKILVAESTAKFKENWLRDYNKNQRGVSGRLTEQDIDKAQVQVAQLMDETFKEEFKTLKGYADDGVIVEGTLLLRPSIINLSVNAPDKQTATRSMTFSESAGEATLFLEVYDAQSGTLLGRVTDRKEDRGTGYYTWTTSVSNRADIKRAMRGWASQLREHFNSLN